MGTANEGSMGVDPARPLRVEEYTGPRMRVLTRSFLFFCKSLPVRGKGCLYPSKDRVRFYGKNGDIGATGRASFAAG
jgi:hypothetical protein